MLKYAPIPIPARAAAGFDAKHDSFKKIIQKMYKCPTCSAIELVFVVSSSSIDYDARSSTFYIHITQKLPFFSVALAKPKIETAVNDIEGN